MANASSSSWRCASLRDTGYARVSYYYNIEKS